MAAHFQETIKSQKRRGKRQGERWAISMPSGDNLREQSERKLACSRSGNPSRRFCNLKSSSWRSYGVASEIKTPVADHSLAARQLYRILITIIKRAGLIRVEKKPAPGSTPSIGRRRQIRTQSTRIHSVANEPLHPLPEIQSKLMLALLLFLYFFFSWFVKIFFYLIPFHFLVRSEENRPRPFVNVARTRMSPLLSYSLLDLN